MNSVNEQVVADGEWLRYQWYGDLEGMTDYRFTESKGSGVNTASSDHIPTMLQNFIYGH